MSSIREKVTQEMVSFLPHGDQVRRQYQDQANLAHIETADGTQLKVDPTLGYFYRIPGPLARSLAGDGSWQQFPVAMDLQNGSKCKFYLPGSDLLLTSPVIALDWHDPGRRITTSEQVHLQFLESYYREELYGP